MKLSNDDVELLQAAMSVCRTVGVEAIVITNGMISGVTGNHKAAILAKTAMSIDPKIKFGLSRLPEFEKRFGIFAGPVTVEGKVNDNDDVQLITMPSGKTKVQYRCTKSTLIKYPKENEDELAFTLTLSKTECNQVTRALKSLGAETVVLKVGRDGEAGFEAIDKTNDQFTIDLEKSVDFEGSGKPTVLTYEADRFATILDAAARDADEVSLHIGEFGSITMKLRGHTILIMPHITGEEEDDE